MPRDPTRQQVSSGLQYVAQKPAFLQNFGRAPVSPPPGRRGESSRAGAHGRSGREPLPERPREGEWAKGSDDEGEEDEDEWGQMYGGGDDGPQVVVLKQGRHLDADQLRKERNRGECEQHCSAGKAETPPPSSRKGKDKQEDESAAEAEKHKAKPAIPRSAATSSSAKRKLVGAADASADAKQGDKDASKPKKKKKADKGLLSFNDTEGE